MKSDPSPYKSLDRFNSADHVGEVESTYLTHATLSVKTKN